jgi:LysR family glycine cleavage system transcriptional activator
LDLPIRHEKRYCLLYPSHRPVSSAVATFQAWVVAQAQAFSAELAEGRGGAP